MRILYVNHTAEVSGGERSLLALLEGLPADVEPQVACPRGGLAEAVGALGVPVTPIAGTAGSLRLHPIHTPRALAEMALAAAQVARAAARQESDVVHANSIRAGLVTGLAPLRAARVAHVRDILPPGRVGDTTLRVLARTASVVLANSRYTAAAVAAAAPRARLRVVYNPVDVTRFDPSGLSREQARARLGGIAGDGALLGVVAQLSPWKGQRTAIEALRLLRDRGVDARLLLIGSAKFVARATRFDNQAYVAGLERLIAEAGLQERVAFLGEREDVPELLRALDVLLLPSEEEPFGRALIEAMALEVPVIATNVGGPPEIVRDGREGYLLDPRDPAAWAERIAALLGDPGGSRAMGLAGRARVEAQFTVAHHVEQVLDAYRSVLTSSSGTLKFTGPRGESA
jgi:glycosyltransferase involved in cell wall biosynthesis